MIVGIFMLVEVSVPEWGMDRKNVYTTNALIVNWLF
jgi:hypothetical protein